MAKLTKKDQVLKQKTQNALISFDEIFSVTNLHKATQACLRGKQDKKAVADYIFKMSDFIMEIHTKILTGKYKMLPYKVFYIYDPKFRMISAPTFYDRVVQMSLCTNLVYRLIADKLNPAACACIIGKGTDYARDIVKNYYLKHTPEGLKNKYYLKLDIAKFYDNIAHSLVLNATKEILKDHPESYEIIKTILSSYNKEKQIKQENEFREKKKLPKIDSTAFLSDNIPLIEKGLPLGNQVSQLLANLILTPLDNFIKQTLRVKHYVRYMDDLLIFGETKNKLKSHLKRLNVFIKTLHLSFNEKTRLAPMSNGISYLGYTYFIDRRKSDNKAIFKIKLRRSTVLRAQKKIAKEILLFKAGKTNYLHAYSVFNAYKSILKKELNTHTQIKGLYLLKSIVEKLRRKESQERELETLKIFA